MRLLLLTLLLATPVLAADFALALTEGEASRDASSSTRKWVVKGTEVTFVTEAHGRQAMVKEDEVAKPTTVKDPAALEAALAVVRKTVDDAKPVKLQDTRYVRGCLIEGKKQYCSTVLEGSSKRLDALNALAATLSP